jgi:hypothetical protein
MPPAPTFGEENSVALRAAPVEDGVVDDLDRLGDHGRRRSARRREKPACDGSVSDDLALSRDEPR